MLIDVKERHHHQITRNNISLRLAILLERERERGMANKRRRKRRMSKMKRSGLWSIAHIIGNGVS